MPPCRRQNRALMKKTLKNAHRASCQRHEILVTSDKVVRPQSGVRSCGLYGRAGARYVSLGSAYVASLRDAIAVPRIPTPDCTLFERGY